MNAAKGILKVRCNRNGSFYYFCHQPKAGGGGVEFSAGQSQQGIESPLLPRENASV